MIKAFCLICCVGIAFLGMPESQATIPTTIFHAAIPIAIAALATNVEPIFVSVAAAAGILATSRSEIYQKIARGELDAVKDGMRTKITFESVKRVAAALPKAQIKLYVPRVRT
jgi:excisionase family DNA binding protein